MKIKIIFKFLSQSFIHFSLKHNLGTYLVALGKATITRYDLAPDSFVLMLRYRANLKAIRYESTSLNRIVADKSHRLIVAKVINPCACRDNQLTTTR